MSPAPAHDHEHPTAADLAAQHGPRVGSLAGVKWLALFFVGFLGAVVSVLAIWGGLTGAIGADAALAQDVESNSNAVHRETVERIEGDSELAAELDVGEDRLDDIEQLQAAQTAHAAAIDAQLEDIKHAQEKQLEILIKLAQED